MTTDDMALLRDYVENDSQDAFSELVSRHVNLVYSIALRQTGDAHLAEEITQVVFIILAKKARSISPKTILVGWLCRTARYASANALTIERRRQRREQEAAMQCDSNEPEDQTWKQISPLLEEAMAKLARKDHDAIVLRFFQGRSLGEVGAAMGASEGAAKKRVNRALEKLRTFFVKRGMHVSTAIIASLMCANSVHAAPTGLAVTISATAVKGSAVAATTLTLVKGTLKIMTWFKLKTAAIIGVAAILAASTTVVVTKTIAQSSGDSPVDDSVWNKINARDLKALPPAFVLRPTQFQGTSGGLVQSGDKMLGRAISFDALMSAAYGADAAQVVSPADKPQNAFDLLMTTSDASLKKLQTEITSRIGYSARIETREADVLSLKVKQTGAPGLRPSQTTKQRGTSSSSSAISTGQAAAQIQNINAQNQPIATLIKNLQGYFDRPILDQTGLSGNFDVTLDVTTRKGESIGDAIMQTMPEQLGLELVPGREAIKVLVVEKAKN